MTLTGKRFLLCGLCRLSVRVAQTLATDGADLTLIRLAGEEDALAALLPASVCVILGVAEDLLAAFTTAGIGRFDCLLALAEEDLSNLRAAVAAQAISPGVPVVLRTFDPVLADNLEIGFNVRRAYSVSALAAPAFIAAAVGAQVCETLRLGDEDVPLCRLAVGSASPLVGLDAAELKSRHRCALIARRADRKEWEPCCGNASARIGPGEEILVGGWLTDVLRLSCRNAGWLPRGRQRHRMKLQKTRVGIPRRMTLLPAVGGALLLILLVAVWVFAHALKLRLIDAAYFVVTTATTTGYGDISLKDAPDWIKAFGCLVMLSGGALLGILFSYLAALATAERLDEVMGRRAQHMSGHVIVAGLGNVGYRVARTLCELGLDVVALDRATNPRADALRRTLPVLLGDVRLPETLERGSVAEAAALIACTDDDLADIQACLRAKRANPNITTVARVFDDALAERLTHAFAIDKALSASHAAVSAFVGAALDERALRPVRLGALDLLACRHASHLPIHRDTLDAWRAQGVRLLALRSGTGMRPPSDLPDPIPPTDEFILCGPSSVILTIVSE